VIISIEKWQTHLNEKTLNLLTQPIKPEQLALSSNEHAEKFHAINRGN